MPKILKVVCKYEVHRYGLERLERRCQYIKSCLAYQRFLERSKLPVFLYLSAVCIILSFDVSYTRIIYVIIAKWVSRISQLPLFTMLILPELLKWVSRISQLPLFQSQYLIHLFDPNLSKDCFFMKLKIPMICFVIKIQT
jgi:GTPase SAR1 family protein